MKLRFIFFTLLFGLISLTAQSQLFKKFSDEPAVFFEELKVFFQNVDNSDDKKASKIFMEQFTLEWINGKFSEDEKKEMISTCNLMQKRKMKPIPHFKNYLSAIISFNNTNQTESSFKAWEASLGKLINRSTSSQYVEYLEVSNNLFTNNVLYKSTTTEWKSNNNDYYFEYDTVPRIIFSSLNLTCYANDDSLNIYNTKGIYYPTLSIWEGIGGKVTWKRAGFEENDVYAELDKYHITVKYSKYTADTVTFYKKSTFDNPLIGKLEDKILADVNEEKATYPRFDSYNKELKIQGIFPNVDYDGGFTIHGAKIIGSGDKDKDAYLTFFREGKKFIKTAAKTYIIRKDRISSDMASVSIYWEKDSIFHPGLKMKYLNNSKEFSLLRGGEGVAQTPFFDTYHKLDMYFEALYWKMDQPLIEMKMIKGVGNESEAMFESSNYYSELRYYKLLGIDETHPLMDLKKYAKLKDTNVISVPEYAKYLKIAINQIEALMIRLSGMGFIAYNIENNKVILKDKLYNFILSKTGKIDYDVLQFNSSTKGESNANISLLNFDLKLNGVKSVYLSDSQNVYIYPKDQKIIVKKNRDFDFDGRVHAGVFDFFGKLFSFSYDKFKIDMPVVDSMSFFVKKFNLPANSELKNKNNWVRVKSVIEGIRGDMQIDGPNNKSGLKSFGQYPIFTSSKDSYVYYNRKSIYNGVYDKERFNFHLLPFAIDSLDNTSTEGLVFAGTFKSASIFPDIDDTLSVQPDYSLGFIRLTPPGGYQAYGGKGVYDSIIDLSNKGLRGNGTLNYITSVSKSNEFVFFPDSMVAEVNKYVINEQKSGVQYPPVIAEDVHERWFPYKDFMLVSKKLKPLAMYDSEAKLHGTLALTPASLSGTGTLQFKNAEMDAKLFKFKNRYFDSDTCDFRLKSIDKSELSFLTYNYKSHVDFDLRKGEFKSNGGISKVEFPINLYICFVDQFDWFMDSEEIDLANSSNKTTAEIDGLSLKELSDVDFSGSEFVSVHPSQDSLRFFAQKAKYNLKDNIIYAKEVKIIKVADAAVFPAKGDVTILKKAEMKKLTDAKLLTNMATKYHTFYDANVNINGRKYYSADGKYDYTDRDSIVNPIYFGKITVDTTIQTYATGIINDTSKFALSNKFDFAGGVKLTASKEFLNFNGAFKINQTCDSLPRYWIKFNADIDPNELFIPVSDSIKEINNSSLEAGLFHANDSSGVYSVFLSKKIKANDAEIITARGFAYYDYASDEYRISNKEKLKQLKQAGDYVSLTTNSCIFTGDGKINLASSTGRLTLGVYGNINNYLIPDTTNLDLAMYLDFFFNEDALKIMTQNLEKYTKMPGLDLSRVTFTKTITEILGNKVADKLISEVALNGEFKKIPSELVHTFLLGDVQMKWNRTSKSFVSEGNIGIVAINKNQFNKYVGGRIEVIKKKSGDEINIYFEFDSNDWYFFNYKQNIIQAISSDNTFNTAIKEAKADNKVLKSEKGLPQISYTISTDIKKKAFL
ncbi:MAG: hypothetical protein HGB12_08225, partial [Bacteroidetes bacterium]|nr:hypothetical protein [Bacteroidota bacterium]